MKRVIAVTAAIAHYSVSSVRDLKKVKWYAHMMPAYFTESGRQFMVDCTVNIEEAVKYGEYIFNQLEDMYL